MNKCKSLIVLLLILSFSKFSSQNPIFYGPLSPEISLQGRYIMEGSSVKYDWPCFKISFCFVNSTKVVWSLEDQWNNYQIIIDGSNKTLVKPRKITQVTIFQSTKQESHCVEIVKITENHYGPIASYKDSLFKGVQISSGNLQKTKTKYDYQFQFLGDSLTTGFGDLSGTNLICMLHLKKSQSCLQTWVVKLSKMFNADYRIQAQSGKGVVKNSLIVQPGHHMPQKFSQVTDNSKPNSYYYQDGYFPDALFVYIGSNDYLNIFPSSKNNFVQGYKDMVSSILRNIMLNTGKKTKLISICDIQYNKMMCLNIKNAIKQVKYAYDELYYIQIPEGTTGKGDFGCLGHPNPKGHLKIAQEVAKQLTPIFNKDSHLQSN